MNALVNYGTDSESEDDDNIHSTSIQAQNPKLNNQGKEDREDEDDPILAALKDLQDFAASVNDNENKNGNGIEQPSSYANNGSGQESVVQQDDDEELKFLSFLQEIDAIPNPDESQQTPPPPPPAEPPLVMGIIPPPPPPPPLPPSSSETTAMPDALPLSSQASESTSQPISESTSTTTTTSTTESIHQSVQMIYNRLYYISLLPSASSAFQDLERRLLEFAIRIVDWTKGGMEEAYFLGRELADALIKEAAATSVMDVDGGSREEVGREETELGLPDFGGIVGSMIQYMFRLEQMATPHGWMAVWDAQDEAYGFQHVRTGLYSPVYPSTELINTLDPPAINVRASPTTYKRKDSWSHYSPTSSSSSPSTPTVSSATVTATMTAPALNPWAAPTTTPATGTLSQSVGSDGLAQSPSLSTANAAKHSPSETTPGATKKKKRKLEDSSASGSAGDDNSLFDQSIHPSRRAALVKNGNGSPASSTSSTGGKASSSSSTSNKVMPKKLASLLQKWNEKEAQVSDDEDDEEYDEGRQQQQQHQQDSSRTGANSQSIGGDWRDRRQQHQYK
ncbi:hypothetical protein BGX24_009917 [Mortierella sp. AD032]|nr:hypothetical protein BGX24_009917 [Mortierella sp. AD032]